MRSLPRIVSQIPNDLRNFLDRVREYLGEGGDDRFVTLRELRAGGVVSTTPGGTITPPVEYGVETPTMPTGLVTTGGLGCIFVEWDEPNYLGHSRTEVWGASTDVFANAVLLGTSPGVLYVDNIGSGGSRYYWIRFINKNEVAGPFNADAGVLGTAGSDPAYLLEVLAGSITDAELSTALNTQIDTNTTEITDVRNLYTVKIDNQGYLTGFGLMSTLSEGGIPTTDFFVNTNRFAVTTPTTSIPDRANSKAYAAGAFVKVASSTSKMLVCKVAGTSGDTAPNIASMAIGALVTDGSVSPVTWQVASRVPLAVLTTPATINGVVVSPGVYIDGASIVNATITNAAIGTAAITDAKIADLSAGKITAGTMQVGSYIQSQSYVAGTSGWKINSDGTAEFAQAVIRGSIFGGSATAYGTGTGLFAGLDAGTYKFRVGNPSGTRVTWDGSNLAIAGGSLTVGTSPAVSGTTMSGSGAAINSSGTFALGNSTTNISFNGSQMTLNGNVVGTANIQSNSVSQMYTAEGTKQFFITTQPPDPIVQVTNVVVPDSDTGVLVIVSFQYENLTGATFATARLRILRDNAYIEGPGGAVPYDTEFRIVTAPGTTVTVARIFADTFVTPGTHSYQVSRLGTWTTNANNNLILLDQSLTCITFKR